MSVEPLDVTVGVLALQGAFSEHIQLLRTAATWVKRQHVLEVAWTFIEVRTPAQLARCDGLIVPGGESTAIALVAARSGLLEPLRKFVKVARKPTWGTCAGLILLAESANRTKKGGQDLIGGLDVRVNRNHFGRQVESFQADLDLAFLQQNANEEDHNPFRCVFIRAPVVEKVLPRKQGIQDEEAQRDSTVVAPARTPADDLAREALEADVEIMAKLPSKLPSVPSPNGMGDEAAEDIIAVRQGNVFATSFHPELTDDPRIHVWWLQEILKGIQRRLDSGLDRSSVSARS